MLRGCAGGAAVKLAVPIDDVRRGFLERGATVEGFAACFTGGFQLGFLLEVGDLGFFEDVDEVFALPGGV